MLRCRADRHTRCVINARAGILPRLEKEAMPARNAKSAHLQPAKHAGLAEREAVWRKAGKARIGMLTTVDPRGFVHSRPMTVQEIEPDGTLWFFIAGDSDVAEVIRNDARVNASFASPDDNFFLSVVGRAWLIEDRQKVEALWTPLAATWFPEGPTDPNLRLLRVDPHRVDYWTSGGGKLLQFLAAAKAALGATPRVQGKRGSFEPD
jgi:general stress protein 26